MFVRNMSVSGARGRVIEAVYKHNINLIGKEGKKASYNLLPSYDAMLWKFWIPVSKLEQESRVNSGIE